jgi:hypothetical protein
MPVGPFLSHDTGFKTLLGTGDWTGAGAYYAVLATTSESPDRAAQVDYEDILEECADGDYDQVAITGAAAAVNSTKVRFTCSKIDFGSEVTISARYLYILEGTAASPANSDEIIGHIDLSGSGNVSSVAAEFSFTPDGTNGLFEIARSDAPA